ncbi:PREDICTED: transcription elongation factor 1 homolog, partial [Chaetura pelagica]|uniref:transcription elongation factor 1 homolog n=1 Tax=Chaetura pelagica TaxID=8897 RepID=UPI000523D8C2
HFPHYYYSLRLSLPGTNASARLLVLDTVQLCGGVDDFGKRMTGTLETQFTCPFCNHEKSCDVKMDRARNTGVISCTVCLEEFQTPITYLSEPVDVYSDWIDACEAANQ